jgi:GTP-binding protein HflX
VGFISDLPHELIEAFRATLEEVTSADVVVHVRDIANADSDAQAVDVMQVLAQIGVDPDGARPIVEVWNKIDLLDAAEQGAARARALRNAHRSLGPVAISAQTGEGVEQLLSLLASLIDQAHAVEADLAPADGQALAWLYRNGRILERQDEADGHVHISVRLDPKALGQFERMFPQALVRQAAE